jgi:hypothetical protein
MDGWGATCSRIPITLRSNSVLLKYQSQHLLYYFDALIPWLHYIPIAFDDEVTCILRVEEHYLGISSAIVQSANAFADAFLTREQAMKYTASCCAHTRHASHLKDYSTVFPCQIRRRVR